MSIKGPLYIKLAEAGDIKYPEPGIEPIEGAGPANTDAQTYLVRRGFLVFGYKLAADILVKYLEDCNSGSQQDALVFPIAFLYRHFVEIALKDVLATIGYDGNLVGFGHDTGKLWTECKSQLETVNLLSQLEPDRVRGFEDFLDHIKDVDSSSFSFRYDSDRKGYPNLVGTDRIQLSHLADTLEKIENFIESIRILYDMRMEFQNEFNIQD
jgi:hypothetical protein